MIINLWSTPRTGSTWYSLFLYNNLLNENKRTYLIKQYLNYVHLINYIHKDHKDFVYEYEENCSYVGYEFDYLGKKLIETKIKGQRKRNYLEEENYRIDLLEKIDSTKNNFIFHNHIQPMSDKSYTYLNSKANRNIYLYRENFIDQISSYALSFYTQDYHKTNDVSDISVGEDILSYLADRVIAWHKLDKSNGEIIKYEDLPFNQVDSLPKKQNNFNTFKRLSKSTQQIVLKLNDLVMASI